MKKVSFHKILFHVFLLLLTANLHAFSYLEEGDKKDTVSALVVSSTSLFTHPFLNFQVIKLFN